MELVGIYTRREPHSLSAESECVYPINALLEGRDEMDAVFLCYGSASDLPRLAPSISELYSTVDSYDNHLRIEEYVKSIDESAKKGGNACVVSIGWDPGFLSLIRVYASAFLPHSSVNTFWGRGVSHGHSEALKHIDGVKKAVQYTIPREDALTLASLVNYPLSDTERHRRVCYIVAEKGKEESISEKIVTMPGYFLGYETEIRFISDEEFSKYHNSISHRGRMYALGSGGRYREIKHSLFLDLDIGSNADLTASIMIAGARALNKIKKSGGVGAYTPLDIPPSYFVFENSKNVNNYL